MTETSLWEIGGKRFFFLRRSVIRLLLNMKRVTTEWQVGDGREEALAEYVIAEVQEGDLDGAISAIDHFCYTRSFMFNVGDEKGAILDASLRRAQPTKLLEVGTYCGYSALRTVRMMPAEAHLYCVDISAANASVAKRIWKHAGVEDRITILVGTLAETALTERLEKEHGFTRGTLDFVFLDHDKAAYLPDLVLILARGWLSDGATVVADNVRIPGAPEYRAYIRQNEGGEWQTTEHRTHAEYQTLIPDLVLESVYRHRTA